MASKTSPGRRFTLLPRAVAAVALVITATAWLSRRSGWVLPLELLSHFQVQYLIVTALLLGFCWLARSQISVLICLLCCVSLATQIVPWYLPPQRLLPQPEANLRVLMANLNAQNHQYERVLTFLRQQQPDIAAFAEVDAAWAAQLDTIKDVLPFSYGLPNPYNLGLLVYSREPLQDAQIKYFGVDKNVSVVAQFAVAERPLTLIATHPLPPVGSTYFHRRNRQLDLIGQYIQTLSTPVVMVGDLNLSMWSPYYRRLINQTGLKNARQGFGVLPTWPSKRTFNRLPPIPLPLLSIPLDHCLISPLLQAVNIHTGIDTGSDHRPLVADIYVPAKS
ncbi:MAG TPA: endonuclease/exonuclease/phosphatase family protein [Trichocoleus sp.]